MGLWGAAQAIAFGIGGFLGTLASDVARFFLESPDRAYASVFAGEAALFVFSALLAAKVGQPVLSNRPIEISTAGDGYMAGID